MDTQTIAHHDVQVAEVLLIEDNDSDVILVKKALEGCKFRVKLNTVSDAEEAMNFLHQKGVYASARIPDLVLLDINLPKGNGLDILQDLKKDPRLNHIPVVVLTTSHSEKDILKTYGLGATCFVTKPMDFPEFAESVCSITSNFIMHRS